MNKYTLLGSFLSGLIIASLLLFSCNNNINSKSPNKTTYEGTHVEKAFYYWKSGDWSMSEKELETIKELNINKLYVKFFEVAKDEVFGMKPISKSQLNISDYNTSWRLENDPKLAEVMNKLQVVPTIFIHNEILYHRTKGSLDSLAENILFLCDKYYEEHIKNTASPYSELQIDCDWTPKTKENYFYLLQAIKALSKSSISCTLRLYPYKFPDKMGVPPVDKTMLMCYNLINPLEREDENSIQNNAELEKYLNGAAPYPLATDIVLPTFSWIQIYQNNQFVGLTAASNIDLEEDTKATKEMWYEVQKDIVIGKEYYLRPGDLLKLETVTPTETQNSINLLKKHLNFSDSTTVGLFHLDENNLKQYDNETYHQFYTDFNH